MYKDQEPKTPDCIIGGANVPAQEPALQILVDRYREHYCALEDITHRLDGVVERIVGSEPCGTGEGAETKSPHPDGLVQQMEHSHRKYYDLLERIDRQVSRITEYI